MANENDIKKEYLGGYEEAVRQMKRSEEKINEMRLNKMCPTHILDGMPRGNTCKDMSDYAELLDREERQYMKYRYQRIKKCKEISDRVEKMTDEDEKDVLMYRYIKLMKWEDICEKMQFSLQHVHRIHSRAIKNFNM